MVGVIIQQLIGRHPKKKGGEVTIRKIDGFCVKNLVRGGIVWSFQDKDYISVDYLYQTWTIETI